MAKHGKELFTGGSLEEIERVGFRPADSLSNLVVTQLPTLLNEIRTGTKDVSTLITQAERAASAQTLRIVYLSDQQKMTELLVARLDVLLLQASIFHSGGTPGPALLDLVNGISMLTNRPATLTYEDIVINNPEHDIRTFTNGEIGRSEMDFYNAHRRIEEELEPSVQNLYAVLAKADTLTTTEIIDVLQTVFQQLQVLVAYTARIGRNMPVEHFQGGFRKYLGELKAKNLRGPSGAFTPRIPLIEFLLMGETISDQHVQDLYANLHYYPLSHQPLLVAALQDAQTGKSVRQLIIDRGASAPAMTLLQELSDMFSIFRNVHLNAVKKHIPELFTGNEVGTGGETLDYLTSRLTRTHGLGGEV